LRVDDRERRTWPRVFALEQPCLYIEGAEHRLEGVLAIEEFDPFLMLLALDVLLKLD